MDPICHVKDEVIEENMEETKRFIQIFEKENMELAQKIETLSQFNRLSKDQQVRTDDLVFLVETQMLRDIIELERSQNAALQTENNRLWQKDNDMELNYGDLQQELGFQRFKYNHLLDNCEKKMGFQQTEINELLLQTARLQTEIENLKRTNEDLQMKIEDLQTEKDKVRDAENHYKYLFSHLNPITDEGREEEVEVEEKKDERVKDLPVQEEVYPKVENISFWKRLKRFISRQSQKISKARNSLEMPVPKSLSGSIPKSLSGSLDMEWDSEGCAELTCFFMGRGVRTGKERRTPVPALQPPPPTCAHL